MPFSKWGNLRLNCYFAWASRAARVSPFENIKDGEMRFLWGFFGAVTAIASGSDKLLGVPAGNRIWHIYNAKQMRTFQAELRCFPFRYHELISCHFHNVTCCSCLCRNYEIIGVLSGIKLIINIQPKRCKPRWSRNLRCKMYNNHKSSMEKEVTIING